MYMIHAQNKDGTHVKICAENHIHKRIVDDLAFQKFDILSIKKLFWIQNLFLKLRNFYVKHARADMTQQRFFSTEIGTMLKAGVHIQTATLNILLHSFSFKLSQAVYNAYQRLLQGHGVSTAFEGYPKIFTPVFLGFLKQATHTGNLTQAFVQFSEYCEYRVRTARSTSMNVLPLVFCVSLTWVVTFFTKHTVLLNIVFSARLLNEPLPIWTEIFEQISPWILSYKALIPIVLIPILFGRFMKTSWVLSLPFLGTRPNLMAQLQFLKVSLIGLKTGMNAQSSFAIAQSVLEHPFYQRSVAKAVGLMQQGIEHKEFLAETKLFNSLHLSLLSHTHTRSGLIENLSVIIESLEAKLAIWDITTGQAKKYTLLAAIVLYLMLTGLAVLYPLLGW